MAPILSRGRWVINLNLIVTRSYWLSGVVMFIAMSHLSSGSFQTLSVKAGLFTQNEQWMHAERYFVALSDVSDGTNMNHDNIMIGTIRKIRVFHLKGSSRAHTPYGYSSAVVWYSIMQIKCPSRIWVQSPCTTAQHCTKFTHRMHNGSDDAHKAKEYVNSSVSIAFKLNRDCR